MSLEVINFRVHHPSGEERRLRLRLAVTDRLRHWAAENCVVIGWLGTPSDPAGQPNPVQFPVPSPSEAVRSPVSATQQRPGRKDIVIFTLHWSVGSSTDKTSQARTGQDRTGQERIHRVMAYAICLPCC
ncbi:hypothetical protein TWF569_007676 [Orbilia oligospora]|uniref:Uncharacterized protein n=1 Tax=Orbilia oligospora TaxID=2813651 RepID=A0A7C8J5U3_ORBOL|nr:hypothetical protein TWF102_010427 [Orbilia oligospora]KAF3093413.1 hypothetical protein TWF103_010955 [Orbilia oligospora]KAF3141897.1 hypothetical protein TWF569_007676 [Orbilia oligospora]